MRSVAREAKVIIAGQAITLLTLEKIKQLQIILPTLPEQITNSKILCVIDDEITSEETKSAIMHVLLTGEVRIKV